jgi:predicted dehydrogenase
MLATPPLAPSQDPALENLRQRWPAPTRPRPIVCIGSGGIVNAAHLPAYRRAGFEVAGVYDIDPDRSRETAQRHAIPIVFASLREALRAEGAVFDVAIPPSALLEILAAMPERSVALLQKPLGESLDEATRLRALCRRRGLTAAVNFQLRFSPSMLALRELADGGRLGRLVEWEVCVNVRTPWEQWPFLKGRPRMEILFHSIHYLDLARSFLGEPAGVYARTVKHPSAPKLASSRSSVVLDYGEDVRCCFSVNHHHAHGPRHQVSQLRIEGTDGAAVATLGVNLDYPKGRPDGLEVSFAEGKWRSVPLLGDWFPDAFAGPMSNLQRFAAGEDPTLLTSVEDAWRTMALVEACYLSDGEGATAVPREEDLAS